MKAILGLSGGLMALLAGQTSWACIPRDIPSFQTAAHEAGEGMSARSDVDQARMERKRGDSDQQAEIIRELRSSPPTDDSGAGQAAGSSENSVQKSRDSAQSDPLTSKRESYQN